MRILFLIVLALAVTLAGSNTFAAQTVEFGGVGIDGAPTENGEIRVRQMVEGGPAQVAGIRVNDIITHVDGAPTKGCNFKEFVSKRLRGTVGSKVVLTVRRAGEKKPLTYSLIRRKLVARITEQSGQGGKPTK